MDRTIRMILSIFTLIILCLLVVAVIWGITHGIIGLVVTCLLMIIGFGLFTYKDYQYFFGKK